MTDDSGARPSLTGSYSYRSFDNNPDPEAADLSFFVANLELQQSESGELSGTLVGFAPNDEYEITGSVDYGDDQDGGSSYQGDSSGEWWDRRLIFRADVRGSTPENEGKLYQWVGYFPGMWPEGINQIPTLVGSVLRAKRPDDPSLEGYVRAFTAVKKVDGG